MQKKLFALLLCLCMLFCSCDEDPDSVETESNSVSEGVSAEDSNVTESESVEESNELTTKDPDAHLIRFSGDIEIYISKNSTEEDIIKQFENYGYISTDLFRCGESDSRIWVESTTIIPGLNEEPHLYECGSFSSGYIIPDVLQLDCGIYVLPFYQIVKTKETTESMEAIEFQVTEAFVEIRITKNYTKGYYEYNNGMKPAESLEVSYKITVTDIDSGHNIFYFRILLQDYAKYALVLGNGTKIPLAPQAFSQE